MSSENQNSASKQTESLYHQADFAALAYAYGKPLFKGELKTIPEDFKVTEISASQLTGEGEHLWCWVEKRGQNTDWVAGMLAKWAGTAKHNVGFAGQKDRQAVTQQWFSIQLPGKADPDPQTLDIDGVRILKMQRHNKKIQRGALLGNRFELVIRNISCCTEVLAVEEIKRALQTRLETLQKHGVPNYFGQQRFGREGNNLVQGEKLLLTGLGKQDRRTRRGAKRKGGNHNQQSLYISALRSWMFNELLSLRIHQNNWNQVVKGDILQSANSEAVLLVEPEQNLARLQASIDANEWLITGGLFGDGILPTMEDAYKLEQQVVQKYQAWCDALSANRVKQDRRALTLMPQELSWSFDELAEPADIKSNQQDSNSLTLKLSFTLPAGSFATMVLREIVQV
ncbi:MAG: tRNA pseudouridine(13) synthase TruD [Thiomicrorhabdus sp.]|nr:tRNA pseudouridine(13) synthase TruD [Thiomicrorhabdus sp.]